MCYIWIFTASCSLLAVFNTGHECNQTIRSPSPFVATNARSVALHLSTSPLPPSKLKDRTDGQQLRVPECIWKYCNREYCKMSKRITICILCIQHGKSKPNTEPKYQIFKSKLLRNPWEYWILYCYIRLWNGKFSVMRSIIKFLQNLTSLAVYESPMIAFFESWVTFIFFSLGHLYSESSVKHE